MRRLLISSLLAAAIGGFGAAGASALPTHSHAIGEAAKSSSAIEDVRLYCYNRYTGQFLHWGPCYRHRYYYYRRWHHHRHWHHYYY